MVKGTLREDIQSHEGKSHDLKTWHGADDEVARISIVNLHQRKKKYSGLAFLSNSNKHDDYNL